MISRNSLRNKVRSVSLSALLTLEKIFVQLKKETVEKIKEVPLIKQEFTEKLQKMHPSKDIKGTTPAASKVVKLTPHETQA